MKNKIFLALSLFCVSAALAKDWPVYPTVTDGMTGPQQITNALLRLSAGDTILVEPGTYDFTGISMRTDTYTISGKTYVITNHLQREIASYQIVGNADGHWNDAIVFKGNGRCLDSYGSVSDVTVRNITFDGFSCNDYPCDGSLESRGGALRMSSTTVDIMSNCVVRGCYAYIGGAVNSGLLIDCFLTNNVAKQHGGAGVNSYLKRCLAVDNRATYYAAIFGCPAGCADSTFINNAATSFGGAIWLSSAVDITNCTFIGNVSGLRGGAIFMGDKKVAGGRIIDCHFRGNRAQYGGAIARNSSGSAFSVEHCDFTDNTATHDGGAVFDSLPSFELPYRDCHFTNNYAAGLGGAVREGVYSNCTFFGNVANGGGAVTLQTSGGVSRCTFVGNVVTNGNGGAVCVAVSQAVRLQVEDCTFRQNEIARSGDGGALYISLNTGSVSLQVEGCKFLRNKILRGGNGGALNVTGSGVPLPWMLSDCVFEENITSNGYGGGVYLDNSARCSLSNCAFTGNVCWTNGSGGAVCASSARPMTDCAFTNNFAWNHGGAVFRGICTNCTFVGNSCVECQGASIWSDTASDNPYVFYSKAVNCRFIENYRNDSTGRYSGQHTEYQGGDVLGTRMENCDVNGGAGSFWRCSMVNCHIHDLTNSLGHCVFGEESWVTNCLINNCWMHCKTTSNYQALFYRSHYLPDSSSHRGKYRGEWVNCTFADNILHNRYGMFSVQWYDENYGRRMAVDFKNCIFYNNRKENDTLADISGYNACDVTYSNCVYGANDGTLKDGSTVGWTDKGGTFVCKNPGFVALQGARHGIAYYTPRKTSKVVGKGDATMFAEGDVDLANNPRLTKDGKLDLGCYTHTDRNFGCSFLVK